MIISQDGKTAVITVNDAQLLPERIGDVILDDYILWINGKEMGTFQNKAFAEDVFRKLLQFLVKGKGLFEVPADF